VPEYNDDKKGIESISSWIADNAGDKVPWHISRFMPSYRLTKLPPTHRKTLEEARETGMKAGLKYVYITNLAPHDGNHTYCHSCGKKVIERLAFKTNSISLKNGKCPYCNTPVPGIW
jgi:pyruvate formate lyase activating enzyme